MPHLRQYMRIALPRYAVPISTKTTVHQEAPKAKLELGAQLYNQKYQGDDRRYDRNAARSGHPHA